MTEYDKETIECLFNEVLDFFQLDVDEWLHAKNGNVAFVERLSKMPVSCYGKAGNHALILSGAKYFSFSSKEDFLDKLGKIEQFASFPKFVNNVFKNIN